MDDEIRQRVPGIPFLHTCDNERYPGIPCFPLRGYLYFIESITLCAPGEVMNYGDVGRVVGVCPRTYQVFVGEVKV